MAVTVSDPSPGTGYKTMSTATMPAIVYNTSADTCPITLPQDLLLDLAKKQDSSTPEVTTGNADALLVDSLRQRINDLEQAKSVTKVKWKRGSAPPPVIRDTVEVPKYYLATQVGNKEGPSGECIRVYEVHEVDEICSGTTISSADGTTEYHIDVGD